MFFCLIFDGHLRTYTAQATASMRGLRRETPGRTARRATLQARHTRIQVVNSLITGGAIIYVDMSSLAKFTRVACRDGTNKRLRLSLLEKK
jgi:hypothetical protein